MDTAFEGNMTTIQQAWEQYLSTGIASEVTESQRKSLKRAFYAGCISLLFEVVVPSLSQDDSGAMTRKAGVLMSEAEAFISSVQKGSA